MEIGRGSNHFFPDCICVFKPSEGLRLRSNVVQLLLFKDYSVCLMCVINKAIKDNNCVLSAYKCCVCWEDQMTCHDLALSFSCCPSFIVLAITYIICINFRMFLMKYTLVFLTKFLLSRSNCITAWYSTCTRAKISTYKIFFPSQIFLLLLPSSF